MDFLEQLAKGPLLADGAMGTELYARGIDSENCLDALNLTQPDMVCDIHRLYAAAGADILETNTFGANRYKLEHHELTRSINDINARGVELARQASRDVRAGILVAGSVGPLGVQLAPLGSVKPSDAYQAFAEQIAALADAGADLLILETFSDLNEILQAVRAARASCSLPIVAQMTFMRDDCTAFGNKPADVVSSLQALGVDVVGANCSTGPRRMLDVINAMQSALAKAPASIIAPVTEDNRIASEPRKTQSHPLFLSAMPNAGFPEARSERLFYPATPDYFSDYARRFIESGVRMIGGCCGTTPQHTRAMRLSLDQLAPAYIHRHAITGLPDHDNSEDIARFFAPLTANKPAQRQATHLSQAIKDNRFIITVEIEPPKSSDTESIEESARLLKDAGATVLDIADSPMARMRMSGLAVAYRIQEHVGLETVLHFPVRGRNLLRVQGDLLAAHALNIRNLLVIMGDPTRIGDYPQASDHHDVVPTGLTQMIKDRFNQGTDSAGSSIGKPCSFFVGTAVNLTPVDMDKESSLLHKKVTSGADFAVTQSLFDVEHAKTFIAYFENKYGKLTLPLIAGILPLASVRHAEYLRNEVSGIVIPDKIIKRLQNAGAKTRTEGAIIAQELIMDLRSIAKGVYIIPAFGRYDIVAKIIAAAQAAG